MGGSLRSVCSSCSISLRAREGQGGTGASAASGAAAMVDSSHRFAYGDRNEKKTASRQKASDGQAVGGGQAVLGNTPFTALSDAYR